MDTKPSSVNVMLKSAVYRPFKSIISTRSNFCSVHTAYTLYTSPCTSFSDIIAEEEGALHALITIFEGGGTPEVLLLHEDALNYTTFKLSWKYNFRDYKTDFLTAIRKIIDVTWANNKFRLFCEKISVSEACINFTVSFNKISKLAVRLANCWQTEPQRRRKKRMKRTENFLRELSDSFGQMLFSQTFLVFKFGNDIIF